jgi:hypothetical protein
MANEALDLAAAAEGALTALKQATDEFDDKVIEEDSDFAEEKRAVQEFRAVATTLDTALRSFEALRVQARAEGRVPLGRAEAADAAIKVLQESGFRDVLLAFANPQGQYYVAVAGLSTHWLHRTAGMVIDDWQRTRDQGPPALRPEPIVAEPTPPSTEEERS